MKPKVVFDAPTGDVPEKAYHDDAGWDLRIARDVVIPAGGFVKAPTRVRVSIPPGWFGLIQERSSMAVRGLFTLGNVIDAGYDGTLHVVIANLADAPVKLGEGERVAQLIVIRCARGDDNGGEVIRRGGRGFGSSG